MPRETLGDITDVTSDRAAWSVLLDETKAKISASWEFSDEEKDLLNEFDGLSESEWQPAECSGKPISQTTMDGRGGR